MATYAEDETHPHFPSGEWEGFYNYDFGPTHKTPMQCQLDFRNGQVTGSGSDTDLGAFSWSGQYDTTNGRCKLIKSYPGRHQVLYDGHADENGIWGKWYIPPFYSGGFHIKPKGKGEEEEEEAIAQLLKELDTVEVL